MISNLTSSGVRNSEGKKATARMFQSTSDSWTYCCALLKTRKSDWDSLPSVSESVRALASQADPLDYLVEVAGAGTAWRRNYASVSELAEKVLDVMEDQASRGQLIKLSEADAKLRCPNLVVASLGANRKDKPGSVVTAQVLFDGTLGLEVNTWTRIRERAP